MRFANVLLGGALLAGIIEERAGAQVVHPNEYVTAEGGNQNHFPFVFGSGAGRYQQSHDASQFPAPMLITEVAFRYHGDWYKPAGIVDFRLTLSYCAVPWNALGASFAANVGANPTVVFDGQWSLEKFFGDPAVPNPFTHRLPLHTPFPYDPALGDLLLEMEVRASSVGGGAFEACGSNKGTYRVHSNAGDPTAPTGTVGTFGLIVEFGSVTGIGEGCAGSGGAVPSLVVHGVPAAGQQVTVGLSNGLGGAASLTLFGLAEASTPLPGGCTLLVQAPMLLLPITLGGTGAGNGAYALAGVFPPDMPPASLHLQTLVADPEALPGFSLSNGLRVTIL